jgi:hypothetical protein
MAAVVSGLSFGQEKLGLNHRLPFQKDGDHPTQIFESCVVADSGRKYAIRNGLCP